MNHMKNRKIITVAAMSALALSLLTVGCGHTISQTKTTRVNSNGTVTSKESTVTERPDGTVTKTETRKTSSPDRP